MQSLVTQCNFTMQLSVPADWQQDYAGWHLSQGDWRYLAWVDSVGHEDGHKGAKISPCQPEDGRLWWSVAACTTCQTRVMICDERVDSEHSWYMAALFKWLVTGWGVNEYVLFWDIMSFCVSALGTAPKLHHCNELKIREVKLWFTSFFHC